MTWLADGEGHFALACIRGEDRGQDAFAPPKARAIGSDDVIRATCTRMRERIDVERSHQRRIQAAKVEHEHVREHARFCFEHGATGGAVDSAL